MRIDVSCPTCGRTFHLNPEMRGQRVICPNPVCRGVFEVKADTGDGPPPEKPRSDGTQKGHVSEFVPILSAEMVAEPAEAPWKKAPPVRKTPSTVVPAPRKTVTPRKPEPPPEVKAEPPAETGPRELPPGAWEPPPVRRGVDPTDAAPPEPPAAVSEPPPEPPSCPPPRRRKPWLAIGLMGLVVAGFGVGGYFLVIHTLFKNEDERYELAQKDYREHKFAQAETAFRKLAADFPESQRAGNYRLLAELSEVRNGAYVLGGNREEALARLESFANEKERSLKPYEADVWETLKKLTADLAGMAQQELKPPPNPGQEAKLERAAELQQRAANALKVQNRWTPEGVKPDSNKPNQTLVETDLKEAIQQARDRLQLLVALDQLPPTVEALQQGEDKARGLTGDPEVQRRLNDLQARLIKEIRFVAEERPASPNPDPEPDLGLLIVPARGSLPAMKGAAGGVVFALARGVLYALAEADGSLVWACRVGIDTATPPVLVPGGDRVLVLSTDGNRLTARQTTDGKALWQQVLPAPCLGRPAFVGNYAYLPTTDGRVHKLHVADGRRAGYFTVPQRLRVGGVHPEGTNLLYLPGESRFLYVLDLEQQTCRAMVPTGHAEGTLRTGPFIPATADPSSPSYLVLTQAEGLTSTKLRGFRLPLEGSPQETAVTVRGWPSFPPWFDAEKIAVATDAGLLGLVGLNQPHNKDAPLFPLLDRELTVAAAGPHPEPALVVHGEGNDQWVLVQGRLHRYTLGLDRKGLRAAAVWQKPVPLGTPLHPAQVNAAGDTLFIVTQAGGQACLATAVEAATGHIRWQRQLGLLGAAEPLRLGEQVVALDSSGGLFRFDPAAAWQLLDQPAEEPVEPPLLLPGPDGQSVYALSFVNKSGKGVLRRCTPGQRVETLELDLPAALAGTPAVGVECLVLPLAEGSGLYRQPLTRGQAGQRGPPWRAPRATGEAVSQVIHLGGDHFLVTDGSNGLQRLRWTAAGDWTWDTDAATGKTLVLPLAARVVGVSAVLTAEGAEPRVAVADAGGTVTLVQADKLKPLRRWKLPGKCTAGPFVRGGRLGCVVQGDTLVWLNPDNAEPEWTHRVEGAAIVGQPQLVGDAVIVADQAGRIVALDPATGKPLGEGYTLQAIAVPAAAPLAYGKDRLFAPLSDGTVLVLPLDKLK